MILTLNRFKNEPTYTMGNLSIDGKFECNTLEDPHRKVKIRKETRIPKGRYQVLLRYSPKFTPRYGHNMLWITKVPGFEYVLIHPGNKTTDTDGCILVGKASGSTLLNSRKTYFDLYDKVHVAASKKELFLEIEES